jgi:hypothetical protein
MLHQVPQHPAASSSTIGALLNYGDGFGHFVFAIGW